MNRLAFCSVLLATAALAEDDVSRAGRQLNFVVALHAPALSSPSTNLNLAADEAQQAKYANRITPVGQRQQFLIGSELRKRYVEEAQLLNEEYIISQMHLQAPFVAKNILSLQAQRMGLYPATNVNDLNEWQQGNAVPPIEGADFSAWQKELGEKALPYGLNTFPIQQVGMRADLVLATNESNCAAFKKSLKEWENTYEVSAWNYFKETYPKQHDIAVAKGASLDVTCDYSHWAYLTNVKLQDADTWASIEKDCQTRYIRNDGVSKINEPRSRHAQPQPRQRTAMVVNSFRRNLVAGHKQTQDEKENTTIDATSNAG